MERKTYSKLVLKALSDVSEYEAQATALMAGKKHILERRLKSMMKHKKARKGIVVLSVVMALVIAATGTVFAFAADTNANTPVMDLIAGNASEAVDMPVEALGFTAFKGNLDANPSIAGVTRLENPAPLADEDVIYLDLDDIEGLEALGFEVVRKYIGDIDNANVLELGGDLARGFQTLNWNLPANTVTISNPLSVGVNQNITVNVSYFPTNANLWVGVMGPNGWATMVRASNGSFNQTWRATMTGAHSVVIENWSAFSVQVSGFVTTG